MNVKTRTLLCLLGLGFWVGILFVSHSTHAHDGPILTQVAYVGHIFLAVVLIVASFMPRRMIGW